MNNMAEDKFNMLSMDIQFNSDIIIIDNKALKDKYGFSKNMLNYVVVDLTKYKHPFIVDSPNIKTIKEVIYECFIDDIVCYNAQDYCEGINGTCNNCSSKMQFIRDKHSEMVSKLEELEDDK